MTRGTTGKMEGERFVLALSQRVMDRQQVPIGGTTIERVGYPSSDHLGLSSIGNLIGVSRIEIGIWHAPGVQFIQETEQHRSPLGVFADGSLATHTVALQVQHPEPANP